jgi:uncharacterized LabA/DUF88 family protein
MKIVYIDAQNIHKATQDIGWTIDRVLFFNYLKGKFELDTVKIFFWYIAKYETLYSTLRRAGYELVFKETLILPNGDIKGNVDIDISIHVLLDLLEWWMSQAYLVTGDGDYNTLVDLLRQRNALWRVLIPHRDKASKLLKKSAGPHIQILQDLKYLIEKKNPVSE